MERKWSNFKLNIRKCFYLNCTDSGSGWSLEKSTFFLYDTEQHIYSDTVSKSHYLPLV